MSIIESHDFTLAKVFEDFYVVRAYQREYVWKEKQVTDLLHDVHEQFKLGHDWEYFIGSIIVHRDKEVYELIDGQQRMTTAYLILCAIRDYRLRLNKDESIDSMRKYISDTYADEKGIDRFKDKVELQYDDSRGVLEKIARQESIDELPIKSSTSSVDNIKAAYAVILKFLETEFHEGETGLEEVRRFYACFIKNVKLVRVETVSIAHALTVFATINNRGLGLDAMDLLKNLMFIQLEGKDFDKLKNKWKTMVDTIYDGREKPLRFLRYFIVARYEAGERLREDRIYDWFSEEKNKKQCRYEQKPFEFVDDLVESAEAFINFKKGKDTAGKSNRYLMNISYFSTIQHLMLLLASQHLSSELFTELCKQIENFLFVHIVTREGTSKLESLFTQWASKIRNVKDVESLEEFIIEDIKPAKAKLAERFQLAFRKLEESSVQKKIMQYILAKLSQYVDEQARGSTNAIIDLKYYIDKKITIEHILPQAPRREIIDAFDRPEKIGEYTKKLGNLTLLESSINSSIKNKPFADKKKVYLKSSFLITQSISERLSLGVNTSVDRIAQELDYFDTWNSTSIEKRQEMLTKLAEKVWDL